MSIPKFNPAEDSGDLTPIAPVEPRADTVLGDRASVFSLFCRDSGLVSTVPPASPARRARPSRCAFANRPLTRPRTRFQCPLNGPEPARSGSPLFRGRALKIRNFPADSYLSNGTENRHSRASPNPVFLRLRKSLSDARFSIRAARPPEHASRTPYFIGFSASHPASSSFIPISPSIPFLCIISVALHGAGRDRA